MQFEWPPRLVWRKSLHSQGSSSCRRDAAISAIRARTSASQAARSTSFGATGGDHCQHNSGMIGATRAAGEGPDAPSQGDAPHALGTTFGRVDPAIVEEADKVGPAPEHVIHGLQDRGRTAEGFAHAPTVWAAVNRLIGTPCLRQRLPSEQFARRR